MIGYLVVVAAVLGTGYAAYRDLMTSEVSDAISFMTAEAALILHAVGSYLAGELSFPLLAVIVPSLLVAFLWTANGYIRDRREGQEARKRPRSRRLVQLIGGMGVVAMLVHVVQVAMAGGSSLLLLAVVTGVAFFLFGAGFYLAGVWGGADAFVMGAMGFGLPYLPEGFSPLVSAPWPFQLSLVLNLFLLGTLYVLGFAFYRGMREEGVMERLWEEVRGDWRRMSLIVVAYIAAMVVLVSVTGGGMVRSMLPLLTSYAVLLIGLLVLYRYLRIVESEVMAEEVAVDELEEGDVIRETVEVDGEVMRHQSFIGRVLEAVRSVNPVDRLDPLLARVEWSLGYPEIVGLTEREIEEIRATRETVTRRTGVRFVPAFPAAVLVSVTVGDLVYLGLTAVLA